MKEMTLKIDGLESRNQSPQRIRIVEGEKSAMCEMEGLSLCKKRHSIFNGSRGCYKYYQNQLVVEKVTM